MGGRVSRNKMITSDGMPIVFYKIGVSESRFLYGSCLPVSNAQMKFFQNECNIGTVISLILEPLKPGRNTNHAHLNNDPEFHDCDADMFDGITMDMLHIPVQDGFPPTGENMEKFLEKAHETIQSGKNVLVHCWLGKGRTATMISGYLIRHEKTKPAEAINKFFDIFGDVKLTNYQIEYLMNDKFPANPKETEQPSLAVTTPKNAPCYES